MPTFEDLIIIQNSQTQNVEVGQNKLVQLQSHIFLITLNSILYLTQTVKKTRRRDRTSVREFKDDTEPSPANKISSKTGVGQIITAQCIYLLKHLFFCEVFEEKTVIMGFKCQQTKNIEKVEYVNGDIDTLFNVNAQGENSKY